MVKRKQIIFDISFWEEFSKRYAAFMALFDKKAIESAKNWLNFYSLIGRSDTIWDCTGQQFAEMTNNDKNLAFLWKKHTQGECGIYFNKGLFSDLKDTLKKFPLATVFSKEDLSGLTSSYGLININTKNYEQMGFLFVDSGVAIQDGQEWSWENIKNAISKANNSMIIVDNYIFKGERNNLYKLLDIILPKSLSGLYYITIFYIDGNEQSIKNIKDFFRKSRPNLQIKLELIQTKKDACNAFKTDFHDRAIITNNVWIGSGAGFNLLIREDLHYLATKSTTVSVVYPFFASESVNWVDSAYNNLLSDAKKSIIRRGLSSENCLLNNNSQGL